MKYAIGDVVRLNSAIPHRSGQVGRVIRAREQEPQSADFYSLDVGKQTIGVFENEIAGKVEKNGK